MLFIEQLLGVSKYYSSLFSLIKIENKYLRPRPELELSTLGKMLKVRPDNDTKLDLLIEKKLHFLKPEKFLEFCEEFCQWPLC